MHTINSKILVNVQNYRNKYENVTVNVMIKMHFSLPIKVATSAAEGPSPPPVIERPIVGRDLSLLIRDCRLSFKADFWLSLDKPKNDQL